MAPSPSPDRVGTPSRGDRNVPSLDGLRAVAVAGVLGVHTGVPGAGLGFLGVDLFFVLSGFLITTLLAQEFDRSGRVDLPRFWGRRFLRLMPAYWLYAGGVTVGIVGFGWGWTASEGGWDLGAYLRALWMYYINYVPLGGVWEHQSLTLHLWSLAVEEQFYFVWPFACAAALRRGRAEALAWGLAGAVLVRRGFAADNDLSHLLSTRGLGLFVGCAVALSARRAPAAWPWGGPRAGWWLTAGLVTLFTGASALRATKALSEAEVHRYLVPVFDAGFAGLIAVLWAGPPAAVGRWLSWRPLVAVGKISYGVYLYHMAAQYVTWQILTPGLDAWPRPPKFAARLVIYVGLTLLIAVISYWTVERPFLKLKTRLRAGARRDL